MFLFLYSFYGALFFKHVICFKTLLSNIHLQDSVTLVLWRQFTLSPPQSGSVWSLIEGVLPNDSINAPPAKSSGFASGFTLLLTVALIANDHSLLLKTCSLCFHCCFDSLPSAGIVLSHLSILLPVYPQIVSFCCCADLFFTVFSPFAFFIRQSLKETITSIPCAWLTCKKVLHRCTFIPARLAPGLPPLKPRLRFHRICLVFVCFLWCPSHGFIFVFNVFLHCIQKLI